MPIYEYRCQSCGHELEKLQRMSDPALTDCPECGKSTLKRLISAAGFRLKGAGWYETDFKKSNQRNLADSGSEKSGSQSSSEGSSKGSSEGSAKGASKDGGKESGSGASKESKSSDSGSAAKTDKPAKPSSSSSAST